MYEKSKFLKEISSMNRDDIDRLLNSKCKRVKKIYPVVFIKPYDKRDKKKNER